MTARELRHIIIADSHFNPLGLARSLGREGIRPDIIIVGSENALIAKSKYPRSIVAVDSPKQAVDYALEHFACSDCKAFLVTGSDKTISEIDRRYDDLVPYFITYNCGSQESINPLMNKARQNELAIQVGLNVPDFEEVAIGEMPKHVKYPIITKAVDSTLPAWKTYTHICHNEGELLQAYKGTPANVRGGG